MQYSKEELRPPINEKFVRDNRGEMKNSKLTDVCKSMNTVIKLTATGSSPHLVTA